MHHMLFLAAILAAAWPAAALLPRAAEAQLGAIIRQTDLPPLVGTPNDTQRSLHDPYVIPEYVSRFSPMVHLYSEERYLPYDVAEFTKHFWVGWRNGSVVSEHCDLATLAALAKNDSMAQDPGDQASADQFLYARSDFDKDPDYITGRVNQPRLSDGYVDAPTPVVVVDKGNGWVDAYWFYFYSFNLGPFVMGHGPYGNHVGDWEHSLVRFYNGTPVVVWMLAHGGGLAYHYGLVEHDRDFGGTHPVIFSARGTHANYASTGEHPHDLPYGMLNDYADRGALWNPGANFLAYTFDGEHVYPANGLVAGRETLERYSGGGGWLRWLGHWGDPTLDLKDPRQHWLIWSLKYIDGPRGPLAKNLARVSPCERSKWWNFLQVCTVRQYLNYGLGVESENHDAPCGGALLWVRPAALRWLVGKVMWGGWFCLVADIIDG